MAGAFQTPRIFGPAVSPENKRAAGYRGIRFERAMRSAYAPGAPTNQSTHLLYNNSANSFLVVRSIIVAFTSGSMWSFIGQQQGSSGTHSGTEAHLWPGHSIGPGQHFYQDITTISSIIGLLGIVYSPNWWGPLPFALLPPGWTLIVQGSVSAQTMQVSFIWEYVNSDQLNDYIF